MSEASVRALLERTESDPSFRERLESASSREEKRQVVAEAGFDVGPGDLEALRSVAGIQEMSDEDLERIAGGTGVSSVLGSAEIGGAAAAGSILVGSAAAAAALA